MKTDFSSRYHAWLRGEVDFTEQLGHVGVKKKKPRRQKKSSLTLQQLVDNSVLLFRIGAVVLCLIMVVFLLVAVNDLPAFGDDSDPTVGVVPERYLEQGMYETGAVNTVAGMILDYRAFDTLGESFVLFTATVAVTILLSNQGQRRKVKLPREVVDYSRDPIVATVVKLVIPVVFMFGVYVLLNGHLSPGGGFSGGAILACAPILFAMVWGDERAHRVFTPKLLTTVTVTSLGFYVVSKTYSFFTGANHLESIISPGTPGRIFSAGLILPLNVAVGCVVCCTMYSFYCYFRKGEL